MEWHQILIAILACFLFLLFIRVPVAFAFLAVNIGAAIFIWGGDRGLSLLVKSIEDSLTLFSLLPIPLFILMGEIMFRAGIAPRMIDTVDKWLGRLPGRLSILSVGGGAILATLTASSMASTAMLGSTLVPELQKRKYHSTMAMGPILGSGVLAVLIPPSALGVLLASMAQVPVGPYLIAIIVPGSILAILYILYVVIMAIVKPEMAPNYDVEPIPLKDKLIATAKYILPLALILFCVIGFLFLGLSTPTEVAAMGVLASLILAVCYRSINMKVLIDSLAGTMHISGMILLVVSASACFSQILSFSGATRNMVKLVSEMPYGPMIIVLIMLGIVIILGTFLESLSIMMLVIPIFFPIALALDIDTLWFAVLLLITIEIGTITPPFGTGLLIMKGVAPQGTTMAQIYAAGIPFVLLQAILVVLVFLIPELAVWLPSLMKD